MTVSLDLTALRFLGGISLGRTRNAMFSDDDQICRAQIVDLRVLRGVPYFCYDNSDLTDK